MNVLIPRIISKDVQLLYTAFGREINGAKKLNFSSTETYKYLFGIYTFTLFFKIISVIWVFKTFIYILILEVVNTKFPNIGGKEVQRQISRWFSGAKDREGGKKERLKKFSNTGEKKFHLILNINKNNKYLALLLIYKLVFVNLCWFLFQK